MKIWIAYVKIKAFLFWAALPGAQHLERCFAPGEIHMTRRAFLSSKSNTGAAEIEIKWASQKLV